MDDKYSDSYSWFISQFPESLFACKEDSLHREYVENVIRGKEIASRSNVFICGIARNVEKYLPYTIARIEKLGGLFNSFGVYIFENDSTDNTPSLLQSWRDKNSFQRHIIIESEVWNPPLFTSSRGITRRKFMAKARNKYLNFLRSFVTRNLMNYIIIVDLDLEGGWSYHGVLNSLGQSQYWDIIGSNSIYYRFEEEGWIRLFYDSWAFRPLSHPNELDDNEANLFKFNRGESMIRVNSCFGGLGIYKPHFLFEGVDYDETDCDHPTLHNKLIDRGYKIFLNPSQITLYNNTQYTI